MPNYTLTHSQDVQGWPSFYSYFPEYIMGMNQYLYTFKNGDLYRHNTNTLRNNYYDVQYNSTITSVLGAGVSCPSCGSSNSWRATECGGGAGVYYLDQTDGFQGSSSILLAYGYSTGDVVWVKQTSTGVITCATIQAISSTPPNYFIDEAANGGNGPYNDCTACPTP